MCWFYIFLILSCRYDGNVGLHKSERYKMHSKLIVGVSLGVLVLLIILLLGSLLLLRKLRRRTAPYQKKGSHSTNLLDISLIAPLFFQTISCLVDLRRFSANQHQALFWLLDWQGG